MDFLARQKSMYILSSPVAKPFSVRGRHRRESTPDDCRICPWVGDSEAVTVIPPLVIADVAIGSLYQYTGS